MLQTLFPYCEIRQLHQEILALHLHVTNFFHHASIHPSFCEIGMKTMVLVDHNYYSRTYFSS